MESILPCNGILRYNATQRDTFGQMHSIENCARVGEDRSDRLDRVNIQ